MKAKIVIYAELENGKRVTAMNEMWFSNAAYANEAVKVAMAEVSNKAPIIGRMLSTSYSKPSTK